MIFYTSVFSAFINDFAITMNIFFLLVNDQVKTVVLANSISVDSLILNTILVYCFNIS